MKIKSLTLQGFRGFNREQTIDFHDRLTLIYAPNSYGKTSISEALEWLLYGITSKVEKADSKDEYKGSYRNRHLSANLDTFVKANFIENSKEITYLGELKHDDTPRKIINIGDLSEEVDKWPLDLDISTSPRPFILQHALKYLLLTKPDDRFQRFARLLGLEILDEIHRNIISLCTAPDRRIPNEVKELQTQVSSLEMRLSGCPSLQFLQKGYKKGASFTEIDAAIKQECRNKVPIGTEDDAILPQLLKIRENAIEKVFKGRISLNDFSSIETQQNVEDEKFFVSFISESFIREYLELLLLANIEYVLKIAKFYGLGIEFLQESPKNCPFCNQSLDDSLIQHIHKTYEDLVEKEKIGKNLDEQRMRIRETIYILKNRLANYQSRHITKVQPLLEQTQSIVEIQAVLVPKQEKYFQNLNSVISDLSPEFEKLKESYNKVINSLDGVFLSIEKSNEDSAFIRKVHDDLCKYVTCVRKYDGIISEKAPIITDVDQVLQHELDILAGTEDISLLIEFFEQRFIIKKKLEIESIITNLKELRRITDNYIANKMISSISGELTSEVMEWYSQIKTSGDPDVHFDGFDMERTQKGEIKARRVKIKAKSYGEELVSAVSSLSESKLNALGLCVSIAINIKGKSPFDFLIIDDPIQSLDTEHETQFIQVIRSLVEKNGKQVVVLSHNRPWLNLVCAGCRSLNGWYYEITGYTQEGPHIASITWQKWQERLKIVDAILKDPNAGTVILQQAEEEIRIVITELSSELYRKKTGNTKSPHKLNSTQVEKMLTECGIDTGLRDRIIQTFCTTDDSHHTPTNYFPDRERIRQYHSWVHELAKLLDEAN
jgi:DNA repair exonuclease SbcCD ATPase subunit